MKERKRTKPKKSSSPRKIRGVRTKKPAHTLLKAVSGVLAVIILAVAGYVAYVFLSYYRLDDNISLAVMSRTGESVPVGKELSAVTWNAGFGAYSADYSFFLDGGKYSRAYSKKAAEDNITAIINRLTELDCDFILLQELDVDSTRSYRLNEKDMFTSAFAEHTSVFAQNYDSPYLLYPLLSPHGKSLSGMLTLSEYRIESAVRR